MMLGALAGCGKKGPPLAPLNVAPEAPQAASGRRLGNTVYIQFKVPEKSLLGTGPFSLDHLEVYAATLAPDAVAPPNRDFIKPQYVVAKIPVRPPPDPDAPPDDAPGTNAAPKPGDIIAFVETLTPALLVPQQVTRPLPPGTAPPAAAPVPAPSAPAPAAPAAAAAPPAPAVLSRIYVVQGVAANGSRGATSARVTVPLLLAPDPARSGQSSFDAGSISLTWQPPVSRTDEVSGVAYNVYAVQAAGSGAAGVPLTAPTPLNPSPLAETTFSKSGADAGKEQCFIVRSVATIGTIAIESDPSEPICVTPRDTFPPDAPKGLAAVSGAGVINLIWDANTDADLGGYLVLRGEAPGDTLQPLTPQPIRETRYADRSVKPGVAYVYAVVAVDRASPPNQSAPSNKVQETAR
jgi:hypothetical protein